MICGGSGTFGDFALEFFPLFLKALNRFNWLSVKGGCVVEVVVGVAVVSSSVVVSGATSEVLVSAGDVLSSIVVVSNVVVVVDVVVFVLVFGTNFRIFMIFESVVVSVVELNGVLVVEFIVPLLGSASSSFRAALLLALRFGSHFLVLGFTVVLGLSVTRVKLAQGSCLSSGVLSRSNLTKHGCSIGRPSGNVGSQGGKKSMHSSLLSS